MVPWRTPQAGADGRCRRAGFPVEASLAALFTNDAKLTAGHWTQGRPAVYIYDNTLYVIDAGQQIKDELNGPPTISPVPSTRWCDGVVPFDYNYDLGQGSNIPWM
jgi:hypothetical protein